MDGQADRFILVAAMQGSECTLKMTIINAWREVEGSFLKLQCFPVVSQVGIALSENRQATGGRRVFNCRLEQLRGGAGKSLARPTSRCLRTESVVSLERGVCSCAELQAFSCYRG